MYAYRVGQPYHPTTRRYPECAQFNWRGGGLELVLFFGDPSSRERQAVQRGAAEFALYVEGDLLVVLYRFEYGVVPWSDAPYSWHLVPRARPDEATLPEPLGEAEESRALLQIVLVDAETGVIKVLRAVTLSPAFTTALYLAIRQQAQRPWPGDAAYDRQLQALYQRYPTSEALVAVAQSRTEGGA